MKDTVLRVMLALVIALTMVIGSASIVSAKGKPQPTVSVEIISTPGNYTEYFTIHYGYSYANFKPSTLDIAIKDTTIGNQTVYSHTWTSRLRRSDEKFPTIAVWYDDYTPTPDRSDDFSITITLTDRKGNVLTGNSTYPSS